MQRASKIWNDNKCYYLNEILYACRQSPLMYMYICYWTLPQMSIRRQRRQRENIHSWVHHCHGYIAYSLSCPSYCFTNIFIYKHIYTCMHIVWHLLHHFVFFFLLFWIVALLQLFPINQRSIDEIHSMLSPKTLYNLVRMRMILNNNFGWWMNIADFTLSGKTYNAISFSLFLSRSNNQLNPNYDISLLWERVFFGRTII